jgi:8-oxo-dGTP diphosphatase
MSAIVPVVCALIESEGRVLLARRPLHKHLGGKWEFPGGKVEPGEAPETALVRECREELGCEIEVGGALPAIEHCYPERTILLRPYVCWLSPGSPAPSAAEHSALAWVEPDRILDYDLPAADGPIVASYLSGRSAR